MTDPRESTVELGFAMRQGTVRLRAGAIESISKESMQVLKVNIAGHMTLYVENEQGLFAFLLSKMAHCAEYADAQAELASEAIK